MRWSAVTFVGTVVFLSFWIGCGGDDLGECPTNSTAAETAGQKVVVANCLYCHSTQVMGSARQGAPDDLNFDKLDVVKSEADDMYEEASGGDMPPTGAKVTGADLENMRIWLACGARDTTKP